MSDPDLLPMLRPDLPGVVHGIVTVDQLPSLPVSS